MTTTSDPGGFSYEPGLWRFEGVSGDSDRHLVITVKEGDCIQFDHAETTETGESVTVEAIVKVDDPSTLCRMYLSTQRVTVPLDAPLGDREVIGGCEPCEALGG